MGAVVPVDLAEEFRRIVPVPLPAVKQVLSLYRKSGPRHGLATIHTEACGGPWPSLVGHSQSFPKDVGKVRDHI